MPNSSYLCTSDVESLYPSSMVAGFDPQTGVVACDASGIPLLWLGMFRLADLVTTTFTFPGDGEDDEEDEDEVIEATAPLVAKDRALVQLDAAVPVLNRLFADEGALDAHAALLRRAVATAPGAFLTIELDEIQGLWEEGTFVPALRAALACLDGSGDPDEGRARLVELSRLRPGRPFPSARLLLDGGLDVSYDDDYWNFVRLLGTNFAREVPWEVEAGAGVGVMKADG